MGGVNEWAPHRMRFSSIEFALDCALLQKLWKIIADLNLKSLKIGMSTWPSRMRAGPCSGQLFLYGLARPGSEAGPNLAVPKDFLIRQHFGPSIFNHSALEIIYQFTNVQYISLHEKFKASGASPSDSYIPDRGVARGKASPPETPENLQGMENNSNLSQQ